MTLTEEKRNRADAFFAKDSGAKPTSTGGMSKRQRADAFFSKPEEQPKTTGLKAMMAGISAGQGDSPDMGNPDTEKPQGMSTNEKAALLGINLPKRQPSFGKRLGNNLLTAPAEVAKGAAGIAGSMFGGKQVGETFQAGLLDRKSESVISDSRETLQTQLDKVRAMDITDDKKAQAEAILTKGLEDQRLSLESNIDTPSGKQVLADLAEIGLDIATLGQGTAVKTGIKAMGLQVGSAAAGAFSETGEIEDAFTGAGVATAMNFIPFAGKATAGFRKYAYARAKENADKAVKGILQVQDKSKWESAASGLSNVDLTSAKTYEELVDATSTAQKATFDAQTEYLEAIPGLITTESATKTIGKRKVDYIKESLDDMLTVYEKEGDIVSAARMDDLIAKYNKGGLSFSEANGVAKEYGGQFKNASFTKAGEAKSSISAARHENVRKGVKDTFRSLLPDDKSKLLDTKASELYDTSDSLVRLETQVFKLENRVQDRKLLERLGKKVGQGLDFITAGALGGIIRSVIPSNSGNKTMNALALQEMIQKNVKLIEKANNAKTDEKLIETLAQIIDQVPLAIRQLVTKPASKDTEEIEPTETQ